MVDLVALIGVLADIPLIGPLLAGVLPFILVLGIVVFVHEYGHYIVGRWCGIHSDAFSLGFGPELFGWTDRRGTRWKLSAIPLGGYVLFKGDANAASLPDDEAVAELTPQERRHTLPGAPIWARMATVAAGPIFNFILSLVIFAGLALALGVRSDAPVIADLSADGQAAGAGLQVGDRIVSVDGVAVDSFTGFFDLMSGRSGEPRTVLVERGGQSVSLPISFSQPPKVASVVPDSAAERACLKPGDVILKADGQVIADFTDLQAAVAARPEQSVTFQIEREGKVLTREITPQWVETIDPETEEFIRVPRIGISAAHNIGIVAGRESVGVIEAIGLGADQIRRVIGTSLTYLSAIFSGKADGSALSGPIGIAKASAQAASVGWSFYIGLVAVVSTAIGFLNLLPVPVLDGGHLVFYALEAARGKPLSERVIGFAMQVGLASLLVLMVFATWNDIGPWVGQLSDAMSGNSVDCGGE
ncbi:MAG: RIP metalloprotease RseP [Neomegalonema sp.]|nr:RIP metalloprotease RseP [Neomegalonema sp.]